MTKKSSKTSHVLSLLTNHPGINENEDELSETKETNESITDTYVYAPTIKSEPKIKPEPKIKSEPQKPAPEEELSEIIKAQLELIADKEEEELTATVSSLNLEYFDEEEKLEMYHYANVVEDIVKVKVLETIKEMGTCSCDKCISDVIAHTLNHLPPKYVVTEKGNLFSKLSAYENQYSTDVTAAIVQACLVVNEHPRH